MRRVGTLVHVAWFACALSVLAVEAPPKVAVHLEIRDELTGSGLTVSVKRNVKAGTNAVDFMKEAVAMEYRRYPGVGIFVTSLGGVEAPDGTFWALSIDGERATKGIADLDIEQPVHIRWDLVPKEEQ